MSKKKSKEAQRDEVEAILKSIKLPNIRRASKAQKNAAKKAAIAAIDAARAFEKAMKPLYLEAKDLNRVTEFCMRRGSHDSDEKRRDVYEQLERQYDDEDTVLSDWMDDLVCRVNDALNS